MPLAAVVAVALALAPAARADVYLHNPRGSNNRNCERNARLDNGNRLFDSQNNAKGGYACPRAVAGDDPADQTSRFYYYAGSELEIQFTQSQDCTQSECQVVVQYMCEDENADLRDGTPVDRNDAATDRMEDDKDVANPQFGYHETAEYYEKCDTRLRNGGLWTADQVLGVDARTTRQNPFPTRRGWECPEERDYYPYWHPTPWTDVAVITTEPARCSEYRAASENVVGRYECMQADGAPSEHNNQADCTGAGDVWAQAAAKGAAAPECLSFDEMPPNRANEPSTIHTYTWTIPNDLECSAAVLRVRYNVTAVPWDLDSNSNGDESPLTQDPFVNPLGDAYPLRLALNTNQVGRVFQDRSYVFAVVPRPVEVPADHRIVNINVRGKRGNMVNTYPALQYDFAPKDVQLAVGDFVHFQWTGSDYNPSASFSRGRGGPPDQSELNLRADRSNVVMVAGERAQAPLPLGESSLFDDRAVAIRLAYIGQTEVECLDYETLVDEVGEGDAESDPRNCMMLNNAKTPYFDGGLAEVSTPGVFHYMSTRNHFPSWRSQRGSITVV